MYGRYPPGNHRNPYPATPAYKVTGEAVRFYPHPGLAFFQGFQSQPHNHGHGFITNCIHHISNNNTPAVENPAYLSNKSRTYSFLL